MLLEAPRAGRLRNDERWASARVLEPWLSLPRERYPDRAAALRVDELLIYRQGDVLVINHAEGNLVNDLADRGRF